MQTRDEPTDGEIFHQYVRQVLVPELRPGDIVVMDNLRAHKQQRTIQAIEAAGCRVEFLPPYSPDLNPIEKMWSKVKGILRPDFLIFDDLQNDERAQSEGQVAKMAAKISSTSAR